MSLSHPNLKGSSPTSFELVCKSGLKIPRQQFTKKLFWDEKRLYKTQGTNASRLQGRGSLTLKELSCTKCFTMIQPATVTLCFKYCNINFLWKEKYFHSHHTKYYVLLTTRTNISLCFCLQRLVFTCFFPPIVCYYAIGPHSYHTGLTQCEKKNQTFIYQFTENTEPPANNLQILTLITHPRGGDRQKLGVMLLR